MCVSLPLPSGPAPHPTAEARGDKVKWVFTWPLIFLLCITIPNCSKPRWEKFFMVTFITATLWIAVFSYLMVWLVSGSSRVGWMDRPCLAPARGGRAGRSPASLTSAYFSVERGSSGGACHYAMCQGHPDGHSRCLPAVQVWQREMNLHRAA